jgi:hypothetical protein
MREVWMALFKIGIPPRTKEAIAKAVARAGGPKPTHPKIQERPRVTPERVRKIKALLSFQKARVLSAKVSLTA